MVDHSSNDLSLYATEGSRSGIVVPFPQRFCTLTAHGGPINCPWIVRLSRYNSDLQNHRPLFEIIMA